MIASSARFSDRNSPSRYVVAVFVGAVVVVVVVVVVAAVVVFAVAVVEFLSC